MIDEKVLLQSRPEALNDKMNMDLQNQKGGYNNGWNDCLFTFIDIIKKQPKVGELIQSNPTTNERVGVDLINCMKNSDIEVDMTYTQAFEKIKMFLKEKCMNKMFFGNGTYCAIGLVEKACMMADERNKDESN